MHIRIKILFPALLVALCACRQESESSTVVATPEPVKLPVERIAKRVSDRLPHIHLRGYKFDDYIATNALALYLDGIDYDHSFFLDYDIKAFQQQATNLDDQVLLGETDFAFEVLEVFKARVTNRIEYVNRLLDKGFDLGLDENYAWKRDEASHPADEAAWNELWRKKVKNEYLARVALREADPEKISTNETERAEAEQSEDDEMLSPEAFIRERYEQYRLHVENNFDREALVQQYLGAFTRSYDPHTTYFSPRGVEDFDISMSLSLVGIGAMLRSEDGMAKITQLIPGGPAENDGRLCVGDKIIAVAQGEEPPVSILHWSLSKAVRLIRGEKGTPVVLTIIPAHDATETRTEKIDLIRDEVQLEAQAAKAEIHEIETEIGTFRAGMIILPEFYADFAALKNGDDDARRASTDIRRIISEFHTNDIGGIILDLRNDGGGALTEAVEIAGLFIPSGPIVQVREKRGISVLPDSDPSTVYSGPLIVMVNRLSASASEIVAAALQDYERAVIVGDSKTHGKGTVQTVIPLSSRSDDLGSLKVTTANFYRIAGGSTQLRGVHSDIVLPSLYDSLEVGEEFLPNALSWSQIRSAYYRPWNRSVKPLLPKLRQRSEMRLDGNEEYLSYLDKRARIKERFDRKEISLKLADRVKEIIEEKEFDDLLAMSEEGEIEESDPAATPSNETCPVAEEDEEEEDDARDLVLEETVRILADMAELSSHPKVRITKSGTD